MDCEIHEARRRDENLKIADLTSLIYHNYAIAHILLAPIRSLYHFYKFHLIPDKRLLKGQFGQVFGRELDLENPKTLNEKIQWLKLNIRSPLHTQCADKYAVRDYVSETVGDEYLVPLLYETEEPANLRPERLPKPPFIIKTTHDSSGGQIVRNKEQVNWCSMRKSFSRLLRKNYYYQGKEWPYKHIRPRLIVEKLLLGERGELPFDYKIHCFHGNPQVIQVDIDRFTDHKRNFYSTNWQLQPFTWCAWRDGKPLWPKGREVPRPTGLQEMLKVARRLSAPFLYARIDLYEVQGRVYFGEVTFYPGGGFEVFKSYKWDRKFGDMLVLPKGTDKKKRWENVG